MKKKRLVEKFGGVFFWLFHNSMNIVIVIVFVGVFPPFFESSFFFLDQYET